MTDTPFRVRQVQLLHTHVLLLGDIEHTRGYLYSPQLMRKHQNRNQPQGKQLIKKQRQAIGANFWSLLNQFQRCFTTFDFIFKFWPSSLGNSASWHSVVINFNMNKLWVDQYKTSRPQTLTLQRHMQNLGIVWSQLRYNFRLLCSILISTRSSLAIEFFWRSLSPLSWANFHAWLVGSFRYDLLRRYGFRSYCN